MSTGEIIFCDVSRKEQALDILVIADTTFNFVNTIKDHLDALTNFSRNRVLVMDFRYFNSERKKRDLAFDRFDVVVLHYSVVVAERGRLSRYFRDRIAEYRGLKIIFIQDEYRWIDETAKGIVSCRFDVIFSVVNKEIVHRVYHHPELANIRKEVTLTGFVPSHLLDREVPKYSDRSIDVGYRARRVPAWLGSFAHEKWLIGEQFREAVKGQALICDIESDERKRLYGEAWIDFMCNCKSMLGTESGASVCDFDGTLQKRVDSYEAVHPEASFENVRAAVLADVDGALTIQVISPRCFEAAALRTLMILYPGSYSGRLKPWHHYVPLERDLSNLAEVIAVLRDPHRAEEIIECAYREVACNEANTFKGFVAHFDDVVSDMSPIRGFQRSIQKPDFSDMRLRAKKYQLLMTIRNKTVMALHKVGHFFIDYAVPHRMQPKVIVTAQSIWRSLFGIG